MIKVYLDDVRATPPGWSRTNSVEETINFLSKNVVTHLSLDNDLGENEPEGYLVVDWLEEKVHGDPSFLIPEITVHSSNPTRSKYMERGIKSIERIRQTQLNDLKKIIMDSIKYASKEGYRIVFGDWGNIENKCACALSCVILKESNMITSPDLMVDLVSKSLNVSEKWINSFVEGFDNIGSASGSNFPEAWILGNEINKEINPSLYK